MTGSLQIKKGYFYAVLNLKNESGKRKPKWIATGLEVKGNKRKANEFLNQQIAEYSAKKHIEPSKVLFCDFVKEWVTATKNRVQITTHNNYVHMLFKHIYPYFKDLGITISQIKITHLERYYSEKVSEGLSPNTVKKHHSVIRSALQTALKEELVSQNVADLVEKPKKKSFNGSFYNQDELNKLFKVVKGSPIETPVLLATYLGLRRSEVIGLKWNCVDFTRKTISINHKVVRAYEDGKMSVFQTDELKTESSYRVFDLEPQILSYLATLKQKQAGRKSILKSGYVKEYSDYICVNEIGDLIKPDFVSAKFKKVLAKNGLKHIRFHDLRHSCASLLLSLDYNMKEIQEWLGHSNYQTTANLYAHVDPRSKKTMINGIAGALSI
jgi:integrase